MSIELRNGRIADSPAALTDAVTVSVPDLTYLGRIVLGPMSFQPQIGRDGSVRLPQRGDLALVAIDKDGGVAWLVNWYRDNTGSVTTNTLNSLAADIAALDARLDLLEAPPKFRVYRNAATSLATNGVVVWDTEEVDTHNWFDSGTGLFTPQRAGAYRFSWGVRANVALTADNFLVAYLSKNGSTIRGGEISTQRGATATNTVGSARMDANGTTDNFGIIIQHNNGGTLAIAVGSSLFTFFDGEFVG